MFGGENQVTESTVRSHSSPFLGLKAYGIKRTDQPFVLLFKGVGILSPVDLAPGPIGILIAQGPRSHNSQLTIKAPVDHQGQFLILEPFQFFQNSRVRRGDIGFRGAVIVDPLLDNILICFRLIAHFNTLPILHFVSDLGYRFPGWMSRPSKRCFHSKEDVLY